MGRWTAVIGDCWIGGAWDVRWGGGMDARCSERGALALALDSRNDAEHRATSRAIGTMQQAGRRRTDLGALLDQK